MNAWGMFALTVLSLLLVVIVGAVLLILLLSAVGAIASKQREERDLDDRMTKLPGEYDGQSQKRAGSGTGNRKGNLLAESTDCYQIPERNWRRANLPINADQQDRE